MSVEREVESLALSKIDEIKTRWHLSTLNIHRSLRGRSGALVFLVEATGAYDGYAILKIFAEGQADEVERHAIALKDGGNFSGRRFPKIAFRETFEGWTAVLMTVAGDGLKYVAEFTEVSEQERNKAIGAIVDGVLFEWNSNSKAGSARSAHDVICEWLGPKVSAAGRLDGVHERFTGLAGDIAGFRIGATDFPNPLSACRDPQSLLRKTQLSPILGLQHGDFHGGNVLVHAPRGEVEVSYFVIDFGHYRSSCPIIFDIAYFELSHLLATRRSGSHARWLELTDVTARLMTRIKSIEAAKHADDVGSIRFVGQIRDLVFGWQEKRFGQRKEDIERQYRLASIAVGLNFASKKQLDESETTSEKLKQFSYLYAAQHLREYHKFEKAALPETVVVRADQSLRRAVSAH